MASRIKQNKNDNGKINPIMMALGGGLPPREPAKKGSSKKGGKSRGGGKRGRCCV